MGRKNLNNVEECENISDQDEVWDMLAYYIAQQCINLLYIVSLEKIIIGGGVINREILLKKTQEYFVKLNNKYIDHSLLDTAESYIVRTEFKNNSGILSAFILNFDEAKNENKSSDCNPKVRTLVYNHLTYFHFLLHQSLK